jgi:drug/metabolite transporter (DMT)-like permease
MSRADSRTAARRATLMLVLATVLWGWSFTLVKNWQQAAADCPGGDLLASLTLLAVRACLALLVLAAVRPRLVWGPTRREYAATVLIAVPFFVGFTLQVWGLARTSPALSAFVTSLASAWVPLLAFAGVRSRVAWLTLLGLGLAIAGTAVLGIDPGRPLLLGFGEALTLLASVLFAVEMLVLERLGRVVPPAHLTAGLLAWLAVQSLLGAGALAACGPGLGVWLTWTTGLLRQPAVLRDVVLLSVFPTLLASHWMNVYQPRVPASRAGLMYLLEPVFASLFSLAAGHDPLTGRLMLGGALILGGNVLAELPAWLRDWRKDWNRGSGKLP